MSQFQPFSLRLTPVELLVLAALQDATLPDGVRAGLDQLGDPETADVTRTARAEEALASLAARQLVSISGDDAFAPPQLLHGLGLLCEGEWVVEGLTRAGDGPAMIDFHLAGTGMEGVLCATVDGGCISLMYRPDGRAGLHDVLEAARLTRDQAASAPTNTTPVPIRELADRPGWETSALQAVSVGPAGSSTPVEVAWLRMGDRLFLLEAGESSILAKPTGEDELRSRLELAEAESGGSQVP